MPNKKNRMTIHQMIKGLTQVVLDQNGLLDDIERQLRPIHNAPPVIEHILAEIQTVRCLLNCEYGIPYLADQEDKEDNETLQ